MDDDPSGVMRAALVDAHAVRVLFVRRGWVGRDFGRVGGSGLRWRGSDSGCSFACAAGSDSEEHGSVMPELSEAGAFPRVVLLGSYTDAVSGLGDTFARVAASAEVHQIFRRVVAFVAGHMIDVHVSAAPTEVAELGPGRRVAIRTVALCPISDIALFRGLLRVASDKLVSADLMDRRDLAERFGFGNSSVFRDASDGVVSLLCGHNLPG